MSFREDRCGTRSRDGTAQRGTQSFDPSRSPSRGVAARRAATHSCSVCLRRIGRIEGEVGFPRNGNETRHLFAPACKRQAMSRTAVVLPDTPPIPDSFVPADLSSWMNDRHAELFAAISTGDQVRSQRLTSMMVECGG